MLTRSDSPIIESDVLPPAVAIHHDLRPADAARTMNDSTTTQILFNSPALRSLKRDQLVRLCKTHSLKANGKNVDLVKRLKQHARTLPKDSPLSIAVRGENNESERNDDEAMEADDEPTEPVQMALPELTNATPRPSEQWEMVMDSIAEEEEGSSKGSLSSLRTIGNKNAASEFGTRSSKSSTVGSSFRALATSLGLKRATTTISSKSSISSTLSKVAATPTAARDELEETATPYSALPPAKPVTEVKPFAFNPARMSMNGFLGEDETPLPGHALRPGVPAPENARLSLGMGIGAAPSTPRRVQPTTTIRLVGNAATKAPCATTIPATPQLKPLATTFDLIMGSPSAESGWPAIGSIYPKLTFDDLPPSLPTPSQQARATPLKSLEPFVFGSPLPKHRVSNVQFASAAASVLEEMNKRLQDEGVTTVDSGIIDRLHPGASNQLSPRDIKPLPGRAGGELEEKFDDLHQKEFQKMEGIDSLLKRKAGLGAQKAEDRPVLAGKKRKSSVIRDHEPRRPGVVAGRRVSGTRVISNGRRARALPGAFGPLDDDDEDGEEIQGQPEEDVRAGKRIRLSSNPTDNMVPARDEEDKEEERAAKEKHREAIKKKLEMNKARRRSSVAAGRARRSSRVSGGLTQAKPKSRFGFLSSAKSLVQSVWNRNKPAASAIPKASTLLKPPPQTKPPVDLAKKTAAPAQPTTTTAIGNAGRVPPAKPNVKAAEGNDTKTPTLNSARARSPKASFGAGSSRASIASNNNTQMSRIGHLSAMATASRKNSLLGTATSRTSSAHVSSLGIRASALAPGNSTVGSMGTRKVASPPARTLAAGSANSRLSVAGRSSNADSSSSRLSTASRLLAPTASSLAKTNRNSIAGLKAVGERPPLKIGHPSTPLHRQPQTPALDSITNKPPSGIRSPSVFSPTRGKVFSTPLHMPSGIPTPVRKRVISPTSGSSSSDAPKPATSGSSAPSAGLTRQRSVNGRKPRISRSKVIAKLASQRAAHTAASSTGTPSVLASKHGGRTRSSLGAKAHRASLGGSRVRTSGGGDVLMSAKKKARQSEYMRRRSRVEALALSPGNAMDVDKS